MNAAYSYRTDLRTPGSGYRDSGDYELPLHQGGVRKKAREPLLPRFGAWSEVSKVSIRRILRHHGAYIFPICLGGAIGGAIALLFAWFCC